MTGQQQPGPGSAPAKPGFGRRVGTALSATVLVLVNLVTAYAAVISWVVIPEGIGDTSRIDGAWFGAFAGSVLAVLAALLTIIPVLARWLRKRWFLVPAVLFVVATARWVVIDQMYPEPEWSAPGGLFVVEQPALDVEPPAETTQ